MTSLVEIRDLLVRRGEHPALQLDDLAIRNGEVLAVVGPNGAGKSTLLLTLARLLKPERGEIWFGGQPASAESDTVYRRRIALGNAGPSPIRYLRLQQCRIRSEISRTLNR